jgi:phosphatidylserine decarboxylase
VHTSNVNLAGEQEITTQDEERRRPPGPVRQFYSKLRRFWLVKARSVYVDRSIALREGECLRCGRCCWIAFRCPHYDGAGCKIHGRHYEQCKAFPIDRRDTELIRRLGGRCGFTFNGAARTAFPITRYGLKPIAAALLVCGAASIGAYFLIGWYSLALMLPAALVIYFFRDPERLPADHSPQMLLAPADGKIVGIHEGLMPTTEERALVIDIFLSILNVHINRAPASGTVSAVAYRKGEFLNALRSGAADVNENNTVWIESDLGVTMAVRQIAGAIARRIVCTAEPHKRLCAGERFGMIKFGSRTQLFLPIASPLKLEVAEGAKVKAGETVLGYIG